MHNFNRFNTSHQYADAALKTSYHVLKPGVIGVVQHQSARKNLSDENSCLNREELVQTIEKTSFTLVAESQINKNP